MRDRGEPIGERNGIPIYKRPARKSPLRSREPKPQRPSKSLALRRSETLLAKSTVIAKKRARGACERCKLRPDAITHHRLPRGSGGSANRPEVNMPANLLRICGVCNTDIETQQRGRAYTLGLLVHRGQRPSETPVTLGLEPFSQRFLLDDDGGMTVIEQAA